MHRALLPVLVAVGALALPALTGCSTTEDTTPGGVGLGTSHGGGSRLTVIATTTQVADFARNVAGDDAKVIGLLKPNVDPHDFEPSPKDVHDLADADVLVENGVGLEHGWLDSTVKAAGFSGTTVDASQGVSIRHGDGTEDEHQDGDPHIWHDPRNAEIMVRNIRDALVSADPARAADFQANAAAYTAKLQALDADIARQIDSLPAGDRQLVTNHDAFGYYVDRYGLTFVGSIIPSFDSSAALSGTQLNDLVAKIRATGTKAVFSESSLPKTTAETLGREAGVRVEAGEDSLYGDTLGPAGSAGATYLEMEEHNTQTIVAALR